MLADTIGKARMDDESNLYVEQKDAALVYGILAYKTLCGEEAKDFFGDEEHYAFWETSGFGEVRKLIKDDVEKEEIETADMEPGTYIITVFDEA